MQLIDLRNAVDAHSGIFHCVQIRNQSAAKEVKFIHVYDLPIETQWDFPIPSLQDFYDTFDNLILYLDPASEDAAFCIASPEKWDSLDNDFRPWLECVGEDEKAELLPVWINDCLVIGEIPKSGNYLLMPRSGEKSGFVFKFEHDGFEFIELAPSLREFVLKALKPSESSLTDMASHMRFVEGDDFSTQWWITEMRDNQGNVVNTRS